MTTIPDFRALCAELLAAFEFHLEELSFDNRLCKRAGAALATPPPEPFVVRHYESDDYPSIKGNGFDGLQVGEDREEAEEFIAWVNKHCVLAPSPPEPPTKEDLMQLACKYFDFRGNSQGGFFFATSIEAKTDPYHSLTSFADAVLERWGK